MFSHKCANSAISSTCVPSTYDLKMFPFIQPTTFFQAKKLDSNADNGP